MELDARQAGRDVGERIQDDRSDRLGVGLGRGAGQLGGDLVEPGAGLRPRERPCGTTSDASAADTCPLRRALSGA